MAVLQRIISILLPVIVVVANGCVYVRLRGDTVMADLTAVNRVSMEIFCPLLVFSSLVGAVVCPVTGLAIAWLLETMLSLDPLQRG